MGWLASCTVIIGTDRGQRAEEKRPGAKKPKATKKPDAAAGASQFALPPRPAPTKGTK